MAVTEQRKKQLLGYYHANKDSINRRKILQKLRTNKQYWVSERVITSWNWTTEQLNEITRANELYRNEQTIPRRVIAPPKPLKAKITEQPIMEEPTIIGDNVYTTGMAEDKFTTRLIHKKNKLVEPSEGTIEGNRTILRGMVRLFELDKQKTNNLLEITNNFTVQQIKDKIDGNKRWKQGTRVKYYGLFGLLAMLDSKFKKLIGDKMAKEFDELYNTESQKHDIQRRKEKSVEDINFRDIYFKAKDKVKLFNNDKTHPQLGTAQYTLALLYTRGMYDKDDENKIVIVPRNYFHEVYLVKIDTEMDNTRNFYNTKTGRMVLNRFKTDAFYNFDYIVPKEVKVAIDAYLKANNNKTFLFEKKEGGRYRPSSLGTNVKQAIGSNIQTYRVAVENFEIQVRNTPNEVVAKAMAHTLSTQDATYLRRRNFEDTAKYLGRRVRVVMDNENSPNYGKVLEGKVELNDGKNTDYPQEVMNYAIVFDKKNKEPNEYLSLPDDTVQFIDQDNINGQSPLQPMVKSVPPKKKQPAKTKPKPPKKNSKKRTRKR